MANVPSVNASQWKIYAYVHYCIYQQLMKIEFKCVDDVMNGKGCDALVEVYALMNFKDTGVCIL